MKTNWIRTLTLAATALAAGTALYAQSRMFADVPFSYRIGNTELPAGKYTVTRSANNVVLLNDGHNHKMAMGNIAYGEEGRARLVFSCTDSSGCTLVASWTDSGIGIEFAKPKPTPAEKERLAVVYLQSDRKTD